MAIVYSKAKFEILTIDYYNKILEVCNEKSKKSNNCCFGLATLVCQNPKIAKASDYVVPDNTASLYGFTIDSDYWDITWYLADKTGLKVYYGGVLLGVGYTKVGIARLKSNRCVQAVLVRFQLDPEDTKNGVLWYHGINKKGSIQMKLLNNQTYLNYAPESSNVSYTTSMNCSVGGSFDGSKLTGTTSIGASTTWTTGTYDIVSKVTNSQKTMTVNYNYSPSWNVADTDGRKKVNKWLNGSHKEYAIFEYTNATSSVQ